MNLVRAELLKVRSTSIWWILTLTYLPLWGLALFFNYLQTDGLANGDFGEAPENQADVVAAASQPDNLAANLYTNGQFFGLLMVMLLGILVVTNEFFHQTVTTTFLTTPHRSAVMLAKLAATALLGLVFWLLTTSANLLAGSAVLEAVGVGARYGGAVWEAVGLNALAYLLWAILGVGIGVLIRSQVGATVTGILLYLGGTIGAVIVISTLAASFGDWINNVQLLVPSLASSLMVTGGDFPGNPPRWAGAAVLVGYAVVAGVVGTLTLRRRDIS
ncbi:ABC transporter permease subunit [Micromonospora sp. WMMA1363]|uniref:ABC transporter permease subunit n=1 Tax=Micromonospora sp. WMMA1363 TaxID=3053985 RepID=UPI00259CF504|nr:ABC transporter permease subunit [Micromonospora sp. WMMA1363]MDM4720580.1 ABC transporter permease subunit [Micromonospora sp. WMMA1363]